MFGVLLQFLVDTLLVRYIESVGSRPRVLPLHARRASRRGQGPGAFAFCYGDCSFARKVWSADVDWTRNTALSGSADPLSHMIHMFCPSTLP